MKPKERLVIGVIDDVPLFRCGLVSGLSESGFETKGTDRLEVLVGWALRGDPCVIITSAKFYRDCHNWRQSNSSGTHLIALACPRSPADSLEALRYGFSAIISR